MSLEIEKLIILSDGHKEQVNKMVDDLGQNCLNKTKDENSLDVQKIKDTLSGYVLVTIISPYFALIRPLPEPTIWFG